MTSCLIFCRVKHIELLLSEESSMIDCVEIFPVGCLIVTCKYFVWWFKVPREQNGVFDGYIYVGWCPLIWHILACSIISQCYCPGYCKSMDFLWLAFNDLKRHANFINFKIILMMSRQLFVNTMRGITLDHLKHETPIMIINVVIYVSLLIFIIFYI